MRRNELRTSKFGWRKKETGIFLPGVLLFLVIFVIMAGIVCSQFTMIGKNQFTYIQTTQQNNNANHTAEAMARYNLTTNGVVWTNGQMQNFTLTLGESDVAVTVEGITEE